MSKRIIMHVGVRIRISYFLMVLKTRWKYKSMRGDIWKAFKQIFKREEHEALFG